MTTATRKRTVKNAPADAPAGASDARTPDPFSGGLLDTDALRELRHTPRTHKFPLHMTAPGKYAEVKVLDFTNPDILELMPTSMMTMAVDVANKTAGGESNPVLNADGSVDPDKALTYLKAEQELARKLCVMGFVQPRLAATPDEADAQGIACVDDINPADRRAYMFFCINPHMEGSALAGRFPE